MTHSHVTRKPRLDWSDLPPSDPFCDNDYMSKQRNFIKQWRKHRGLTQAQLAERIGIAESYVSKIEGGKRRYDQPFLEAAAEVLRCEPADLLIRDPSDPEGLWSLWDQLKPVERKQAVEIIQAIRRTGTEG